MGLEIQDTTICLTLFADDQLLIAQDYKDLEYMTRELTFWSRNFTFKF